MKKLILLPAIGAAAILTQTSEASLLFSDGFNYTPGDDLGAGSTTPTWTATATPTSNMAIGSQDLTYSGAPDPGGNSLILDGGAAAGVPAYAALSSSITSGSVYYSFLIDCTSVVQTSGAVSYLTSLTPSEHPGANGTSTDALAVYAKYNPSAGSSTWELGIRINGASATYASADVLNEDQAYLAVVEYTFNGTTPSASLYIDPTPGGTQPTANLTLAGTEAAADPDISDVSFKAQTAADGNYIFNDVYVGTTWADVDPTPEPTTMALAGIGALGLYLIRRRR